MGIRQLQRQPRDGLVFKAANHAAMAVNLPHHNGNPRHLLEADREVHDRAHGDVTVHSEEHAVGGDVWRLCRTSSALRLQLHGQMQGKPGALCISA